MIVLGTHTFHLYPLYLHTHMYMYIRTHTSSTHVRMYTYNVYTCMWGINVHKCIGKGVPLAADLYIPRLDYMHNNHLHTCTRCTCTVDEFAYTMYNVHTNMYTAHKYMYMYIIYMDIHVRTCISYIYMYIGTRTPTHP